ncbi:MAG TPA: rod shape-determining protein MreD [Candidatus Acidoferrum sp.]|nr:rod shape-determining protein MreD [Candidatus Acidoferrum sp.]
MRIERSRVNLFAAYGLLMLVSALLSTTMLAPIRLHGVTPTLYIAATVCVAMFEGEWKGAVWGLMLGYCVDATVGPLPGLTALTLLAVGFAVGVLARVFMLRRMLSAIVLYVFVHFGLIVILLLLKGLVEVDLTGFPEAALQRAGAAALSALYIPPFYFIARWLHLSFGGAEET